MFLLEAGKYMKTGRGKTAHTHTHTHHTQYRGKYVYDFKETAPDFKEIDKNLLGGALRCLGVRNALLVW